MTKYFFDIETEGRLEKDTDGLELASLNNAKAEAVKAVKSIADDLGSDTTEWTIVSKVRDGNDRLLFEARLHLACDHIAR